MSITLLKNIHTLVTMTGSRTQPEKPIRDAVVLVRDNQIAWAGAAVEWAQVQHEFEPDLVAAHVIDMRDHIVLPGLVNTHHHLYQTLTRCIAQDSGLFNWLKTLYPIWLGLTSEAIHTSALTGMAELMLSGCTTASDHLYIYPNDCSIDDEVRAAQEIGLRFHATRGSMSLGESQGGLPPDKAVEREDVILRESVRAIEKHHDARQIDRLQLRRLDHHSPVDHAPVHAARRTEHQRRQWVVLRTGVLHAV